MKSLKVLDVTLRDGGCVNDFNFGNTYIEKILKAQEEAGIDIVELGYIDGNKGSEIGRTKYINEKVIEQNVLKNKRKDIKYVAMIDYGKYDIDKLGVCTETGIDGIRLAFHKKDRYDIVEIGSKIMSKGYSFYIQPMITLRYSDNELIELIQMVNEKLSNASGFYIVDSFGEMRPYDMNRIMNLVDTYLIPTMPLGFHSHNNLQMSYSNAISMLQFPTNRELMIDSSIMGMGKGAGNLNTELLLEHLNLFYGKNYNISPLLEVMDKVINQLHSEYYWGYAPEYYLSATYQCTPSYASYFYNKHMLPINKVGELLGCIDEEKKISFDESYAEKLYRDFNERQEVDDTSVINDLKNELSGNEIVLVAPGRSVGAIIDKINEFCKDNQKKVIGLNSTLEMEFDYLLTTRHEVFENAMQNGKAIIVPSNIAKSGRGNVKVINYANWIISGEKTYDSSAVIALNLIKECDVKTVYLAGFDGFSIDLNENYYDINMRHPINAEQAKDLNSFYRNFIKKMRGCGFDIRFITPSKYEE